MNLLPVSHLTVNVQVPKGNAPVEPESASFAEERREVFESVISAWRNGSGDADELAACRYLLRHLCAPGS
ncbi:MAG: hypothetical protein ABI759_31930 [Candidatus Solibacter sp.]